MTLMGREGPEECDVAEGLGGSTFLFRLSRSFLFSPVLSSIFKLKVLYLKTENIRLKDVKIWAPLLSRILRDWQCLL